VAPRSDSALSYEFLLTRVSHILKSPTHARETMLEFQQDWANLERASARKTLEKNALRVVRAESARGVPRAF
jgi:hypothetical protein